jgi:nitroimidazol reductase NimA-like FMN-containing flavoprotein (pyridoxamine 5'-phosphate oxidase superfamily)
VETWLETLSEAVCWHELRRTPLGRLAVVIDGRPDVFPVNHVVDVETDAIVFPSNPGTKFHAALEGSIVAFEADGVDVSGRSAWSVVAHGPAREIIDDAVITRARRRRVPLWAVDDRSHWVAITVQELAGRRISTIPAAPVDDEL